MKLLFFFFCAAAALSASLCGAAQVSASFIAEGKQPQVAVNDKGTAFVVFGKQNEVLIAKKAKTNDSFSSAIRIGELNKLALGMRRGPRVITIANGVIVTAISHAEGNLIAWLSPDGNAWSKPVMINSVTNSAREGLHALASRGSEAMIVWLDLRNGKTQLWGAYSKDGGETWGENMLVYKSPDQTICECCHPSVAFTDQGEVVVMWRNWVGGSRDMYYATSANQGKTFSPAVKLGTGTWKLQGCPMDGGSVAVINGAPLFAWRREGKLFYSEKPTDEIAIASQGTQPVILPSSDRDIMLFWQQGSNLWWKQSPNAKPELFASNAGYVSGTYVPGDRRTLLVWEDPAGLYWQFQGLK